MSKDHEPPAADLITEAHEQDAIRNAGPDRASLIREFGRSAYSEKPNGDWQVAIRKPDLSQAENDRRGKRFVSMYGRRIERERERSFRREASQASVAMRRADGLITHAPPEHESRIAAKGGVHAVRYWGRPTLRCIRGRWYRRVGDRWNLEGA